MSDIEMVNGYRTPSGWSSDADYGGFAGYRSRQMRGFGGDSEQIWGYPNMRFNSHDGGYGPMAPYPNLRFGRAMPGYPNMRWNGIDSTVPALEGYRGCPCAMGEATPDEPTPIATPTPMAEGIGLGTVALLGLGAWLLMRKKRR